MSRSTATLLLKSLVSVAILFFLLSRIDMAQLIAVLSSVRLFYVVIALGGYVLGQVICSVRWAWLSRSLGFGNRVKDYVIFYFIGMFFNLFAPSTIGGDVGRVFYLARDGERSERGARTGPTVSALVSVLADRLIGLVVLVWIGAAALGLFPTYSLPVVIRTITFALAAGSLLAWPLLPLLRRLAERWDIPRAKNLLQGLATYARSRRLIAATILLSLITHFIQSWMHVLIGRALGAEIPWSYSFILYPLVGIFSALPVSFNGIGLREGGYLFLLSQIGMSSEKAIAFSLLWFLIVTLDSLLGGIVFILRKSPRPSAVGSEIRDQVR